MPKQSRHRNYRTQISEPVPVTGVERGYVGQGIAGVKRCPDLARDGGHHSAVRINRGRNAGVGVTQQPTVIFYRAHARLFQVLRVSPAVAVPAVVGNVHKHLRSIGCQLPDSGLSCQSWACR